MEKIIIWAAILIISFVVECCTTALVSIWFVPPAAVCIILQLCGVTNIYIQIAVFVVLSALLIFLMRKKIRANFKSPKAKTNVDSLIGKTATVEESIPDGGAGRVNVGGMSWAAFSEEKRTILSGEKVTVLGVSGVKLLCAPFEKDLRFPTEQLLNKQARVEKSIDNFGALGTVICEGTVYLAKSCDNCAIYENTIVRICDIDGEKVVCEKLPAAVDA